MIAVQALVNISVVLGLLPTKGIPLPLVSSGGSSLLINLLGDGRAAEHLAARVAGRVMSGAVRCLIAGGGTGGHLYPGIAVARELLARVPDAQVTFVGTAAGIESRVVPREGFALDVIRSAGLKGKSLPSLLRGHALAAGERRSTRGACSRVGVRRW